MAYSDDDKAGALAVLASNNGDVRLTARRLGVDEKTIRRWRDGDSIKSGTDKKAAQKKQSLSDLFEDIAYRSLGLAAAAAEDASFAQLMTGAGIAVDKMRLLREQPTAITEDVSNLPDDELDRRIAVLEGRKTPAA